MIIKKAGKPKSPDSMTPAERKTKERARIRTLAEVSSAEQWDERVCILILGTTKYSKDRRHEAWGRLGQLNGWVES